MIFAGNKTTSDIEGLSMHVLYADYKMLLVLMNYCEETYPKTILDIKSLISIGNIYISSFIAKTYIIKFNSE